MNGFKCPNCGSVSHNPNDAIHGYCGRCHEFVVMMKAGDPVRQAMICGAILSLALQLTDETVKALLDSPDYLFKDQLRTIIQMRDRSLCSDLADSSDYALLVPCFYEADSAIAAAVAAGLVPKAAALVVFAAIRDAVRIRAPKVAELLVPRHTEAVLVPERRHD